MRSTASPTRSGGQLLRFPPISARVLLDNRGRKEFIQSCYIARGSASEVDSLLLVAKGLGNSLDLDINHRCHANSGDPPYAVRDRADAVDWNKRFHPKDCIEIGLKLRDGLDLLQPVLRA